MKKVFSILFIVLLIIGLSPQSVFAEVPTEVLEADPDPVIMETYPYYAQFYYTQDNSHSSLADPKNTYWVYSTSPVLAMSFNDLNGVTDIGYDYPTSDGVVYKDGVDTGVHMVEMWDRSSYVDSPYLTFTEFMANFNTGYWELFDTWMGYTFDIKLYMLQTNMTDIWYQDTETMYEDFITPAGGPQFEEDPLGYIEIQYDDINISNSSVNVTVRYLYNPTQYGYNSRNWDFDLDSENGSVQIISHQGVASYWSNLGYSEGYMIYKVSGLPIGTTEINAYLGTYDGTLMYSDIGFITRTAFVDSDGDGFDDITGMPADGTSTPDIIEDNILDMPDRSSYDDGIIGSINYSLDMLMYYITLPFKWIAQAIGSLAEWLANSIGWIENISSFFNAIFGFLPQEFTALIYIMVLITVIFSMFKLMRG